jgi:UDP-N-acetylmuramoylalanine-D-glutamate ligase
MQPGLECTSPLLKVCPEMSPVIDMLSSRKIVPIIAVTGTNGKTTTTRLLAHIVKQWLQSRFHYSDGFIFKIT